MKLKELTMSFAETIIWVLVSWAASTCYAEPQQRRHTTSFGHELILDISDTIQQNSSPNIRNDVKIIQLKDTEGEEISLTNNLVSSLPNRLDRPIDHYSENSYAFIRMTRPQRRCCKRGKRAARKGMNCNHGFSLMEADLRTLHDFKETFKLSIKINKKDSSFFQKAMKCFRKQGTAQYYARCCRENNVIRRKRNN